MWYRLNPNITVHMPVAGQTFAYITVLALFAAAYLLTSAAIEARWITGRGNVRTFPLCRRDSLRNLVPRGNP